MRTIDKLIDIAVGTTFLTLVLIAAFMVGRNTTEPNSEPQSDYIWIDNNRFHSDSLINCETIYSEDTQVIGCYIRVIYQENVTYIECLDENGYTWEHFRDSWIMAFKEQING